MANVEVKIKGLDGIWRTADVKDFDYRLNRTAFIITSGKLKSQGGTTSTKMKLDKDSKRNALIFAGRNEIESLGKFSKGVHFEAEINEDGSETARGTFRLEDVNSSAFEGTFFDRDSGWIEQLSKVRLNRLGYKNNKPTWLAPFNGAETFDEVNDKSNRETDFIVPTVIHNNTPILDYLDFADSSIWGEFDQNDERISDPLSFPSDFNVINGFSSVLRYGLKFDFFPPAWYYRNVIEKIFEEIGMSVDCTLFYEDFFNTLYMTYEGDEFLYNWKNIGSVYSTTPSIFQGTLDDVDQIITTDVDSGVDVNKSELPFLGGSSPTQNWIGDEQFLFKIANIIKHDSFATGIDKCTLTNSFEREGQYLVPANGSYKIKVNSQIECINDDFTFRFSGGTGGAVIWDGGSLFNSFGTWDSNSDSSVPNFEDRHFGWDDNMIVVLRKSSTSDTSKATLQKLFEWMNGQNKDFTSEKSDVIAYFSPKRWKLKDGGDLSVLDSDISGSPYNDFDKDVIVKDISGTPFVSHDILSNTGNLKQSESTAAIEIDVDLSKGDLIEIFWISLGNMYGRVLREPSVDPVYDYAIDFADVAQNFGATTVDPNPPFDEKAFYSIDYLCGEYDLDLATNLPNMSGKDFIASFINQFNLNHFVEDKTVSFYPVKQYYSKQTYDITSRVNIARGWSSKPIETPKTWVVGYDNDPDDRLLNESIKIACEQRILNNYANVSFDNTDSSNENTLSTLSMFSATKFVRSPIAINPFGFDLTTFPYSFPQSCSPLNASLCLTKGFQLDVIAANAEFALDFPSTQNQDSFKVNKFGDFSKSFKGKTRLLYHLGTANQYSSNYTNDWGVMVDMPRADIDYINLRKHWFRPTVSQFDGENSTFTGINYRTLRYDGETGLYVTYFENLLEFFSLSEILTLYMAITSKDWQEMKGSKKIRFYDQLYRLMEIRDYDPVTKQDAIIKLLKEV